MKKSATKREVPMRKEYDFSGGVRGRFFRSRKIQKTLRLDEDILIGFQQLAATRKIGYQTLINQALRAAINRNGHHAG